MVVRRTPSFFRNLKARLMLWSKPFRLPRFRLVHQLLGFFVLVVLIPLLALSYSVYSINQNAVKKQVRHFSQHTALAAYQQLELEMSWQKKQLLQLENYLRTKPLLLWAQPQNLKSLFVLYPNARVITLYQPVSGQVVLRLSNPYKPLNTNEAMEMGSQFLPPIQKQSHLSQSILFALKKIEQPNTTAYRLNAISYTNTPETNGYVLSVYQDFPDFTNIVEQNVTQFKQSLVLFMPDGTIMASSGNDEYTKLKAIPIDLLNNFQQLKPAGTYHIAGSKPEDIDKDGEVEPTHHKVLMKLPSTGWGIILETPYALQKEYIRLAQVQTLILLAACVLLIVVLGLWYSRSIYRNFRQLIKGIQALAEGNYSRQIRLITRAFTPFEIIYLTSEFNRMAGKVRQSWEDIQKLNIALADANTKLAKLDETKSNLIDTVSHELRTPLTSIKGYTSRLIRSYDQISKEDQIKNLKVVKQQADRLSRLVEDLLVIPELEQGGEFRVYLDCVDVKEQLRRSVALIQDKAEQTIDLTLPNDPVLITADQDRMEQVILNVLDNAAKYAPVESIIRVGLEAKPYGAAPKAILTFFNASEHPITEEEANHLFDKFTRLDERLTRTTRGTGLGLFITRGLIETMGGQVILNTQNGFMLTIEMPLATTALEKDIADVNPLQELNL